MTATKKAKTVEGTKVRAAVGRERQLALVTRAMLDALGDVAVDTYEGDARTALINAGNAAETLLENLGYGTLRGIPAALADLENQLRIATVDKDYAAVTRLGKELERVRTGKPPRVKSQPSE